MILRGAISGFGEVAARAHLAGWNSRQDVQIVAIHDPVAARRHRAINLIKNIRVYDDLELMLDGEALDFLDIASPPRFHTGTARAALQAGVHVLVEKPLCLNLEELQELKDAASMKSRVLMCVHNWKYSPAYRRAHELAAGGRLGNIQQITLERLRTGPAGNGGSPAQSGERWRLDQSSGGGILIDHGWHAFYLVHWLMGGKAPKSVSARLHYPQSSAIDEAAEIRIEHQDGTAFVNLSWRANRRSTTAEIVGDRAKLEISDSRLFVTWRDNSREDCSVGEGVDDSYHPEWFAGVAADFVHAVEQGAGGPISSANLAEADVALALIVGARESDARGGGSIPLGLK